MLYDTYAAFNQNLNPGERLHCCVNGSFEFGKVGFDSMPIISVAILKGRSAAQRRALIRELADGAMRALGVPEQSVRVILTEIEPEHWGVGTRTKVEMEG